MNLKNVFRVGGFVRDQLLGLIPNDVDYLVIGETPEKMLSLGFTRVGEFPVFLHPETHDEWALGRTEKKVGSGYNGFDAFYSPDVTLDEDLSRRDLTINAMAMDENGNIFDPFDGRSDLKNKILRHTTEAFAEDPLRVLRIARFLARFGPEWTIHPETRVLMDQIHATGELSTLTPERIWIEMEKALGEDNPQLFFETLNGYGIFPELEDMVGVEQPAHHHPEGDVFIHTMLVLKRAADLGFDKETRFAALCHDFGKPVSFAEHQSLHGHEQEGVSVIESFCKRLTVPNKYRNLAKKTSDNHTRSHKFMEMKPKKVYGLIVEKMNAEKNPIDFLRFLDACVCDAQGRGETMVNTPYPQSQHLKRVFEALMKIDGKQLSKDIMSQGFTGQDIGRRIREEKIRVVRLELAAIKDEL